MKTAYKLLIAGATVASLASFASIAKADTAAGSAAFSINNAGVVTGVAMSAAVSEQDSLAVAMNTQLGNATFALGSASTINAPEWTRPADGTGNPNPGTEMMGNPANIYIYDGEPEYDQGSMPMPMPE